MKLHGYGTPKCQRYMILCPSTKHFSHRWSQQPFLSQSDHFSISTSLIGDSVYWLNINMAHLLSLFSYSNLSFNLQTQTHNLARKVGFWLTAHYALCWNTFPKWNFITLGSCHCPWMMDLGQHWNQFPIQAKKWILVHFGLEIWERIEGSNGKWKRVPTGEVLPMKTALQRVTLWKNSWDKSTAFIPELWQVLNELDKIILFSSSAQTVFYGNCIFYPFPGHSSSYFYI